MLVGGPSRMVKEFEPFRIFLGRKFLILGAWRTVVSGTCLVTGGSGSIGSAIVSRLRESNWDVYAPGRDELNLEKLSSVQGYLSSNNSFDAVVLNAGINPIETIEESRSVQQVMAVNLLSNYEIVKKVIPHMVANRFGRIVAISSQYSSRTKPGRSLYSMSKAALESMVRSVAVEYSSSNVLANAVAPGFVDTELTRKNNSPQSIEEIQKRIPVGRLADPSEIATVVEFFIGREMTYISGQTLSVDGGWSCT